MVDLSLCMAGIVNGRYTVQVLLIIKYITKANFATLISNIIEGVNKKKILLHKSLSCIWIVR